MTRHRIAPLTFWIAAACTTVLTASCGQSPSFVDSSQGRRASSASDAQKRTTPGSDNAVAAAPVVIAKADSTPPDSTLPATDQMPTSPIPTQPSDTSAPQDSTTPATDQMPTSPIPTVPADTSTPSTNPNAPSPTPTSPPPDSSSPPAPPVNTPPDSSSPPAPPGNTPGGGNPSSDAETDLTLAEKAQRLPKFGLLVNDLECGLCHVRVIGDVASTRTVPPLWLNSQAQVVGRWLAASSFDAATPTGRCTDNDCLGIGVNVTASAGIVTNYSGPELPIDTNHDGQPDFPSIDFSKLASKMRGSVSTKDPAPGLTVSKVHSGNLVLVGTESQPIVLDGDVLVTGDLVIKGRYTGTGTMYVRGNIYIPADLQAARSAFPYPADEAAALIVANQQMTAKNTDALGLASEHSIFIGDIQKHQNSDPGNEAVNVYNHPATPANRRGDALGVLGVLDWFPGGNAGFDLLYDQAVSCLTQGKTQLGSFNLIEAFIYAKNAVAGVSRRASYSIRGGVIADYFHIVQGSMHCDPVPSPVHGRASDHSYIEYDYRLKTGLLQILEQVGDQFPKPLESTN